MPRDTDSLYKEITAAIIEALKGGVAPWVQPWWNVGRPLRHNGLPFVGLNSVILRTTADKRRFESPYWLTAAQGKRYRAKVREGQEATAVLRPVVAPLPSWALHRPGVAASRTWKHRDGERVTVRMQPYGVLNAEQFDRLPPRFQPNVSREPLDLNERIERADLFFDGIGAKVRFGGDEAMYRPHDDVIQLPEHKRFTDAVSHYSTLAHELVHWTGHASRLKRDLSGRLGDTAYSWEELLAEFGAAFLMGVLDLPQAPRNNHAAYIDHWLERLERDNRALASAVNNAQTAADYLTIASAAGRVDQLAALCLDEPDYLALYFDRVNIRSQPILVAIALDARGYRRTVGVSSGSPEQGANRKQAVALLSDLVARGLSPDRRRLFVTGGSADLLHAIRTVFGPHSIVQRCRSTVVRTVLSALKPRQEGEKADSSTLLTRERVQQGIREAFRHGEDGGTKRLIELAGRLQSQEDRAAATALRGSLPDLFSVDKLALPDTLRGVLSTTHLIARAQSWLPRQICSAPTWQDPTMTVQWAVASFLDTDKHSRRISGCHHLHQLRDKLQEHRRVSGPTR